ncbi:putative alcohol dehydrogenase [Planoprotostelium fungivorum]|uniref:Putative alcohol dehydrogenase n=1 Tax=Planoprotostelium fungivorum TaxID=1890364 RepID=A0A2P6N4H0_9EUKA|nr:putative alcohol dehydrogenase [Planoprotostelium fungivorum]
MSISYQRWVGRKQTSNFREAAALETDTIDVSKLKGDEVVLKIHYAGVNASDVNFVAGRYDPTAKPPFYPGFEAVGVVTHVGPEAKRFRVGAAAAASGYGFFSEYAVISEKRLIPVPSPDPEVIPLLVGGLTASLALQYTGEMKSGQKVLVTAAAGGTGHFAVQFAKLAGNHVIGTCSSDDKVEFLKKMGCDRVINYKKENLAQVLKKEYPKGVDIVYESVGGETYETCVNALATHGKLIIIGFVSGYKDQSGWVEGKGKPGAPLVAKLLAKSASVRGFFLNHFDRHFKEHMGRMVQLVKEKKLISQVDNTATFRGLESVPEAIDHMYQGKNVGKVVVAISSPQAKL